MRSREASQRVLSFRQCASQPPLVRVLHEGDPTDPTNLPVSPLSTASKPPPHRPLPHHCPLQVRDTRNSPRDMLTMSGNIDTAPRTGSHEVKCVNICLWIKLVVTIMCGACRPLGTVARKGTRLGQEHSQEGRG